MNLILFSEEETRTPLPVADPRSHHILHHLKRLPGDRFDVGLIDGPRGKAWIEARTTTELQLAFHWEDSVPERLPLTLLAGLPRPQTARRILREAAAFGIEAIRFFEGEKGVPSYRTSRLWVGDEWRRRLIEGAEQAFSTRLPQISLHGTLDSAITALPSGRDRIALDVYEADRPLSRIRLGHPAVVLALGPERGWASGERELLRKNGFRPARLGDNVLRSDTACLCGITLILATLGKM